MAALWIVFSAVYCILSVLLRIPRSPPLMFPGVPCALPYSSPSLRSSFCFLLSSSSARFLPSLSPSLRPCLVPSLPRSFPPLTLPLFLHHRSLPPLHHRFLPHLVNFPAAPSLPPSIIPRSFPSPSLQAFLPPSNSMYTVCVCVCVRACVRACVCVCVRACVFRKLH